jgi:hypothetical protein
MNASLKDDNMSMVTSKLFGLILKMPFEDRLRLLTEVERKQQGEKKNPRRKYDRQDYLIDIDYTVKDRLYKGLSINLSASGIFIESPKSILPKFSLDDQVMLSFHHPGKKEHVKITGRISRIDEKGIGVMFNQPIVDWWTT